jgi:hypothetical protein
MWLWAATSDLTEVFRLLPDRGGEQVRELLGESFSGILHRDRAFHHWHSFERGEINRVERTRRKALLWRKGSFGSNSPAGALFVERILTITRTAHRRGTGLLDWLTRSIQASLNGYPALALA